MSGSTFQLRRSNWKLKIENQFFFQFQGPIGQNNSKNIPTDISKNMIENYDLFVSNGAKMLDLKDWITEGFW